MYTISSEQVIGSYAVKYKTLCKLINKEYAGSTATTINIFIDLTGIIHAITSRPVTCDSPYSITASIVNLCAHYRNFFRQYYNVDTIIHIILSDMNGECINSKYAPGYSRSYMGTNDKINNMIDAGLRYLCILVPYIEDISFNVTNYEFGVFMMDILSTQEFPTGRYPTSIVLSKDPYSYQLVLDSAIKVLRPRKEDGEDLSYMINRSNVLAAMCQARKSIFEENDLNPELLPLIYSLTRVPERNIPSIHQIPTTIRALNKAVDSKLILNYRSTDIEYICNVLKTNRWLNISDPMRIRDRFSAIDILSQYGVYINSATGRYRYAGMKNLYDPVAVKEISTKYFKDYPLDLNVL